MRMPREHDATPALDTTSSQNVTADTEDIARARLRSSRRSCLEHIAQVDHGQRGLINVAQDAPKSRLKSMPWIKGMYVRVSAPITREKLAVLISRDFGDNHSKVCESSLILNERIIQHFIRQRIGTLYISVLMRGTRRGTTC